MKTNYFSWVSKVLKTKPNQKTITIQSPLDYLQYCLLTFKTEGSYIKDKTHCEIGISSEIQELMSQAKAALAYNRDLTEEKYQKNLVEELGDLLYFCTVNQALKYANHNQNAVNYFANENFNFFEDYQIPNFKSQLTNQTLYIGDRLHDFENLRMTDKMVILLNKKMDVLIQHYLSCGQDNVELVIFATLYKFFKDFLKVLPDGITILDIAISNQKKLQARYPEGYSDNKANNRNKETEMNAL